MLHGARSRRMRPVTHILLAEVWRAAAQGFLVNGQEDAARSARRNARLVLRKDRIGRRPGRAASVR